MSKMNMCTPCSSYGIIIYSHLQYHDACFLFTEIEYMLFFTGQQETEQCLLPLFQQVNMLYRTCICGQDYTTTSRARFCILNVKYSNVDRVKCSQLYCVLHHDRLPSTGGVYTGFHAGQTP